MIKIAEESDLFVINLVHICIAIALKDLIDKTIQNNLIPMCAINIKRMVEI